MKAADQLIRDVRALREQRDEALETAQNNYKLYDAEREQNRLLTAALAAVLLFHSQGEWDQAKRIKWFNLTQSTEATTEVLCDVARAALAAQEGTGG